MSLKFETLRRVHKASFTESLAWAWIRVTHNGRPVFEGRRWDWKANKKAILKEKGLENANL